MQGKHILTLTEQLKMNIKVVHRVQFTFTAKTYAYGFTDIGREFIVDELAVT